jgi:hypothetical protein
MFPFKGISKNQGKAGNVYGDWGRIIATGGSPNP